MFASIHPDSRFHAGHGRMHTGSLHLIQWVFEKSYTKRAWPRSPCIARRGLPCARCVDRHLQLIGPRRKPKYSVQGVLYSDDDGKTWFADSVYRVAPFDHNGKTAVAAQIYTYEDGRKEAVLRIPFARIHARTAKSYVSKRHWRDAKKRARANLGQVSTWIGILSRTGPKFLLINAPGPSIIPWLNSDGSRKATPKRGMSMLNSFA